MRRAGAAVVLAVLAAAACGHEDRLTSSAPGGAAGASATASESATPYPWSDCAALRAGDALTAKSFDCPEGQATVSMLNCDHNETYVHMVRPGQQDLEGMIGVTTWLAAEPIPSDDYRTRWAREHCHEVD